jgi:hypothetical protein
MDTAYGVAAIRWEAGAAAEERSLTVEIGVPAGASGVFVLPPGVWSVVNLDSSPVAAADLHRSQAHSRMALELGAGRHSVTLTGQ